MKKLITLTAFLSVLSINVFAGTLGVSDGSTKENSAFIVDSSKMERIQQVLKNADSQVYYIGEDEAEVQFATNIKGSTEVEVQSLKPEQIPNEAVLESLRKSQQSKQWIEVKKLQYINDVLAPKDSPRRVPKINGGQFNLEQFRKDNIGGAVRGGGIGAGKIGW